MRFYMILFTQCSLKLLHFPVWWKLLKRQRHSGRLSSLTKSSSYDLWYIFLVSFDHLSLLFIHLFDIFGTSWCLVLVFLLQRVYSWTPRSCFQLEIKKSVTGPLSRFWHLVPCLCQDAPAALRSGFLALPPDSPHPHINAHQQLLAMRFCTHQHKDVAK